jgi:hypothetical protein
LVRGLNGVLGVVGFELRRAGRHDWSDVRNFIPFEATLAAAAAQGLSVADYVDVRHNRAGATQEAVDRMAALGAFAGRIDRVCEIGPGSGRYLEKIFRLCKPSHYEIYETAADWAGWLQRTYAVVPQPTDGKSLSATPARSIDLVHAHKVLTTVPWAVSCGYLLEMARVVRDGGRVVFDVMTEACTDQPTVAAWAARPVSGSSYPAMMPRQFLLDVLEGQGLRLVASFFVAMEPGRSECMIFERPAPAPG